MDKGPLFAGIAFSLLSSTITFFPLHAAEISAPLVDGQIEERFGIPESFTASQIAQMMDGDPATGVAHVSLFGGSLEDATSGIIFRFEFDISAFSHIDSVQMDWSGTYEWTPEVEMYPDHAMIKLRDRIDAYNQDVPYPLTSSPEIRSGTLRLLESELTNSIVGNHLVLQAMTGLGHTFDPAWTFLGMGTREVSLRVFGELAPTPAGVMTWGGLKALYR